MRMIDYTVKGRITPTADAAYLEDGDTPQEELVAAVVSTIAIHVEVTCAGVTLHLAAWMDPAHWQDDWEKAGVDDPEAFIAGLA